MRHDFIPVRRSLGAVSTAVFALLLLGAGRFLPAAVELAGNYSPPDSASAIATVERFHAAVALGDTTTVLTLLAPDVVIIESGGLETLRDYRSHHLAEDVAFAKAVPNVRTPFRAAVQGGVAWVSCTSTTKGRFKGRSIDSAGAELMVLTRTGPTWRIRAIHWSSHSRIPRG
jgi:ketosteroid isomerase-like protein